MLLQILQDGLFAAIAAVGFAAISRPPKAAYLFCAIIAAVGHSARFLLMSEACGLNILGATAIAAFIVGLLSVWLSPKAKIPPETCLFPSLLPMIPGMYAYRAFGGLALCLTGSSEATFSHDFYLFASNGLTCLFILLVMVIGATIPIFLFRRRSFTSTRESLNTTSAQDVIDIKR